MCYSLIFNHIFSEMIDKGFLSQEMAQNMQKIWQDEGILLCYERGHEYSLPESASYFLDDLERLSLPEYVPSEQDILRSRARTTGIVEIFFHYKVI